jgi:hypothetical protein
MRHADEAPDDAIIISANPNVVDNAVKHLATHDELYRGFQIDKRLFSFPLFTSIHISGGQANM